MKIFLSLHSNIKAGRGWNALFLVFKIYFNKVYKHEYR